MNSSLESLLASAPTHIQEVLTSPETSKIVSSIAHANRVPAAATASLHAEVVLLILGVNNIDYDAQAVRGSLISGGISESSVDQVIKDIKTYIIPKIQKEVEKVEIKSIVPREGSGVTTFSNAKLSKTTLETLSKITTTPMITAEAPATKEAKRLDPYREDMV